MAERRFMRALICGWSVDGQAIRLRFQYDDDVETDVWVHARDMPEVLLRIQEVGVRASQATTATPDGVRYFSAQKVAQFTVGDSLEGVTFLDVAFASGLKVQVAMSDQTVDALGIVVTHLQQKKEAKRSADAPRRVPPPMRYNPANEA